jgi:Trypsin-like peptidase domain
MNSRILLLLLFLNSYHVCAEQSIADIEVLKKEILPNSWPIQIDLLRDGRHKFGKIVYLLEEKNENSDNFKLEIMDGKNKIFKTVEHKDLILIDEKTKIYTYETRYLHKNIIRTRLKGENYKAYITHVVRSKTIIYALDTIEGRKLKPIDTLNNEIQEKSALGIVLVEYPDYRSRQVADVENCNAIIISRYLVMTNFHCIYSKNAITNQPFPKIYPDFISMSDRGKSFRIISLVDKFKKYDMTLLELENKNNNEVLKDKIVALSNTEPNINTNIFMVQHYAPEPWNWEKQVSNDENCVIFKTPVIGKDKKTSADFIHGCDSAGGSSGSGIFSEDSGHLVGLHRKGKEEEHSNDFFKKYNKAVRMTQIIIELEKIKIEQPDLFEGYKVN